MTRARRRPPPIPEEFGAVLDMVRLLDGDPLESSALPIYRRAQAALQAASSYIARTGCLTEPGARYLGVPMVRGRQ